MWLFWLYEFLGFIAVLVCIFLYCHFFKQKFWRFIWTYLKWVALAVLLVWLLISIFCYRDLYSATQCYFRGVSMKANTKYSLFLSECQIETPRGVFVPIDRTRALPGSEDNDATDSEYGN